jgi:imidazole glycerol-phosphate synthase subunit HisH
VTQPRVTVLDYGSGNVHSACRALEAAGAQVTLTADRKTALEAHGLVVPGVGAFAAVMQKLQAVGAPAIIDSRLAASRSVLGICVGMQVMFERGLESSDSKTSAAEPSAAEPSAAETNANELGELDAAGVAGLGQWPGVVERLEAKRLPNIGWSKVEPDPTSDLMRDLGGEHFYFVHSYAATRWLLEVNPPFKKPALTWATHEQRFLAAVENGPLSATQFHPEKSGAAGIRLLENWLSTL